MGLVAMGYFARSNKVGGGVGGAHAGGLCMLPSESPGQVCMAAHELRYRDQKHPHCYAVE